MRRLVVAHATLLWKTIVVRAPIARETLPKPPRRTGSMNAPRLRLGFALTWRIPDNEHPPEADRPARPPRRLYAFYLTRRVEALTAACADPGPVARRLAHQIARRPQRLPDILRRLRRWPHHPRRRPAVKALVAIPSRHCSSTPCRPAH